MIFFPSPVNEFVTFPLAIDTEAINLIAGEDYRKKCRTPDIMADAVYTILTQDSRSCTGNFFVDETLLRQHGVTDFDRYAVVPGTKDLMLDFFLDENLGALQGSQSPMGQSSKKPKEEPSSTSADASADIAPIFDKIQSLFSPDLLKKIDSIYAFDLQGKVQCGSKQRGTNDIRIDLQEKNGTST